MSRSLYCPLAATIVASCAPGVPDQPTWADDVAPILAANCVRCHTVPAIGGAPASFRLDTYEDWVAPDGSVIRGAGTMGPYIAQRIDPVGAIAPMPPRDGFATLSDRQIDVLSRWLDNVGSDRRPVEGAAGDGNRAPELTILERALLADRTVAYDYEITDPDGDIVTGELVVGAGAAGGEIVDRTAHSGRGRLIWDVGAFADGTYGNFVVLRDPSGSHEIDLGPYEIVGNDDLSPEVTVDNLRRDSVIGGALALTFDLVIDIADPDSGAGELTMTITAHLGDTTIEIPAPPATVGTNVVPWDLTPVPQGDAWRLVVTVADQTSARAVEVGPFIIGKATPAAGDTFASISDDFLGVYCTYCHPGAQIPGLTHDFTRYDGQGEVLGARELAGQIYRRAAQQRNMPPGSVGVTIPAADVARLQQWIFAGAPE